MLSMLHEKSGNHYILFPEEKCQSIIFEGLDVSKVHQTNELGVMTLFWILYRKVS